MSEFDSDVHLTLSAAFSRELWQTISAETYDVEALMINEPLLVLGFIRNRLSIEDEDRILRGVLVRNGISVDSTRDDEQTVKAAITEALDEAEHGLSSLMLSMYSCGHKKPKHYNRGVLEYTFYVVPEEAV